MDMTQDSRVLLVIFFRLATRLDLGLGYLVLPQLARSNESVKRGETTARLCGKL